MFGNCIEIVKCCLRFSCVGIKQVSCYSGVLMFGSSTIFDKLQKAGPTKFSNGLMRILSCIFAN